MKNNKTVKTKHFERIETIESLYFLLLQNEGNNDIKIQNVPENLNEFQLKIYNDVIMKMPDLIKIIQQHLKPGWMFENLPYIEKAILLLATYEILYLELSKGIVINEAVIIAKNYSAKDAYKYINGVLDKINK